MMRFLKFFFLFLLVLLPAELSAAPASEGVVEFNKISKNLTALEKNLKSGQLTLQGMDDGSNYLYQTSAELDRIKKENERQAALVQKQLDALGAEPEDGTLELDVIAKKRKEFKSEMTLIKSRIAEVDVLQVKIDDLKISLLNSRNQQVLGGLLNKQSVLIEPETFISGVKAFLKFVWDIAASPAGWYKNLGQSERSFVLKYIIPVIFILIGAFWLGLVLRRLIMQNWGYRTEIDNPRYGQKILAALSVAVAYGVIPALIIVGFLIWMVGTGIFTTGLFGLTLSSTLYYLLYVILGRSLARVIFAPYNERWRLINVGTTRSISLVNAIYLSIELIGAVSLLEHVAYQGKYSQDLISFLMMAAAAIKSFVIVFLTAKIFTGPENQADEICETDDETEDDEATSTSFKIIFFSCVAALITFTLSVLGYQELSAYILNRFILSAVLFVLFMIVHRLLSEVLRRILLLGFWGKTFRLRRRLLNKINFGLSLIMTPLLALLFLFAALNIWGLPSDLILHAVKKLLFGFQVGGVQISLIAIVLGIVVFFGSLALVKTIKNRLTVNVFSKLDIDDGIKHSLSSGVSFVGFILSSLLAIIVMGGNLTSLAVIAGALSVGIGFGLQNIVNNFISGIIILFERPFKVGDWVIFNGEEGTIKQINIRSTELETFNRTSVIIPNATLISSSVTNLTHGNNWTRQAVKVGVAYGTDVQKVTAILLECAKNNKKVLKVPAPYVLFQDFGASSLDFELRCYSSNIWTGWSLASELRYEINRRFIEEGIEIPFQQMVIHQGEKVGPENQFYARRQNQKNQA